MNTCLEESNPCRSLGTAALRGVERGDDVIGIIVLGGYDDVMCIINGVKVLIYSKSSENMASMRSSSGTEYETTLLTVSGGQVEVRHLIVLQDGGSSGAFFDILQNGVIVLNESLITGDADFRFWFIRAKSNNVIDTISK
jgi:hypothetical protein